MLYFYDTYGENDITGELDSFNSLVYDSMIRDDVNYARLRDFTEDVFGMYGINPDIVADFADLSLSLCRNGSSVFYE